MKICISLIVFAVMGILSPADAAADFQLSSNGKYYLADECSFNNKNWNPYSTRNLLAKGLEDCVSQCENDEDGCSNFQLITWNSDPSLKPTPSWYTGYSCTLFNINDPIKNAIVIPTRQENPNVVNKAKNYSCGFLKRNITTKPSMPTSYTRKWNLLDPGIANSAYTSVGCKFGLNSTPLVISESDLKPKNLNLSEIENCSRRCFFTTEDPWGYYNPLKDEKVVCTHFNFSPSDSKCTMFSQLKVTGKNFAVASNATTCGFIIGMNNQPPV